MRLTTLFFVGTTAMASRIHLPEDNNGANMLLDRAIDPADMNPTQLSILSVLKTAIPSGTSIPMPTGTSEPDWYKNLPDDVKSLLPQFYPATTTSSVESTSSSISTSSEVASQASSTPTPTPTSTPVLTSSLASETSSAVVSAAAVTSASVQVSSVSTKYILLSSLLLSTTILLPFLLRFFGNELTHYSHLPHPPRQQ